MFVLSALLAGLPSALVAPQSPALVEDFNLAVPPAGWTQIRVNPATAGWILSSDGRAWHEDESSAVGTCEDLLISPVLDLSAFAAVYAHFSVELTHADYLANNPGTLGDGETDLYVRRNGGAWTEAWTETRSTNSSQVMTVDLTPYAAHLSGMQIALRYYGTFAHATWVDWIQVDADPLAPPPPPPPPADWTVNLPLAFVQLLSNSTLEEGFEAYSGVLPPHMAATRVSATTGLPDPEAWCDIAGAWTLAASGTRCLEMGLIPTTLNYHYARNALVIGYDGSGTGGLSELGFSTTNFGEEVQAFDGVWISVDGGSWYRVYGPWTGLPLLWTAQTLDLRAVRHLTDGPFYLMLAQEDNFPYGILDGLGLDELKLKTTGSAGPSLSRSGPCPGSINLTVVDATPAKPVAFFYGLTGSTILTDPQKPCLGLVLNLRLAVYGGFRMASLGGVASMTVQVPGFACRFSVQAVDAFTCRATNRVDL